MRTKILDTQLNTGALALMLIMAATRFHHFGDTVSLPDASLAVFFLGGLWRGGIGLFVALLLEAGLIDYIAISHFGVSDFCISPAYVFLVPTYACVWLGGRYCQSLPYQSFSRFAAILTVLVISVSLAFVISNGSFYLLSDKYPEGSWSEYAERFMQYYPSYLQYAVMYVLAVLGLRQFFRQLAAAPAENHYPKT